MSLFLRINFSTLGVQEPEPAPGPTPWELYARCDTEEVETCALFQQITSLTTNNRKSALSALHKLVQVAASGQPITEFYDKKQCHDLHTFNYHGKDRIVWRIRKGDVRVTFYYGEGRMIILTHAFAKYENKLTNAQKAMLETEISTYIDAVTAKSIHFIEKLDDERH